MKKDCENFSTHRQCETCDLPKSSQMFKIKWNDTQYTIHRLTRSVMRFTLAMKWYLARTLSTWFAWDLNFLSAQVKKFKFNIVSVVERISTIEDRFCELHWNIWLSLRLSCRIWGIFWWIPRDIDILIGLLCAKWREQKRGTEWKENKFPLANQIAGKKGKNNGLKKNNKQQWTSWAVRKK